MRIHVLSDLHLEFGPIHLTKVETDLVILAGDIHTKLNGIRWIRKIRRTEHGFRSKKALAKARRKNKAT